MRWSPSPSVGGGGDQPVVLARVPDGQPQVIGERMAGPERARHEAAPQQAFGGGGGALGRPEVDEQEVRDRRPDRPADRASAPSVSRSRSRLDAREVASRTVGSRSASVTTVTETVETEPGGRYGFIRAITSGRASANPTRRPASA